MATRPCLGIPGDPERRPGHALARGGPRCRDCAGAFDADRRAVYDSPRWRRLSRRRRREHVARYGPWCPGWGVPAHVAFDLTLDHDTPLELGGAPFDGDNLVVGCRACNDRKGTNVGGWGTLAA